MCDLINFESQLWVVCNGMLYGPSSDTFRVDKKPMIRSCDDTQVTINNEWQESLTVGVCTTEQGAAVIVANPKIHWDYEAISAQPYITWAIVKANVLPWNYRGLSMNPNVTWEIVKANPNHPWNYKWLSLNSNIDFKIMHANVKQPWDYDWYVRRPARYSDARRWDLVDRQKPRTPVTA